MLKRIVKTTLVLSLLLVPLFSVAQSVDDKIKQALKMDYRTEAELARDADRKPLEALTFMGLRDNMKVIEFAPARQAWYSKILAPVLADKGQLYLIDSQGTFDSWGDMLKNPAFKSAKTVPINLDYNRAEFRYNLGELKLGVTGADMFLSIREYHNFNDADKARLNKAAFGALKSGGHYVVIDHTRRHMQQEDQTNFRREDPVQTILDVQAAGFVLEKVSDMFYNPVDELNLEVGNQAVTGQTDRFFLVFKKP